MQKETKKYEQRKESKMNKIKKTIGIMLIFVMLFTNIAFAQVTIPKTISDLDYMKENYFKGGNNTYKNIEVGGKDTGKVMSVSGHSNPNTDVYILTVREAGIVTIQVVPLNKQYYTSLNIGGVQFVSNVSGEKKYYSAGNQSNSIVIEDYNGYGSCLRNVYLDEGIYYFSVSGKQYTKEEQVTNYLDYVDYQITVTSQSYSKDPNIDTNQSNPYTFVADKDTVKGSVAMGLIYSESSKKYSLDTSDRYMIPAGNEREVKLKISNTNSNPLNLFKKEIEYKRNDNDKQNLEIRRLTSTYKSNGNLTVSVKENGSFKLLPGESKELSVNIKKDEGYYIDLSASFPSEYTITYEELGDTNSTTPTPEPTPTPATPTPEPTENLVKPIIMLHTACEIPAETFDKHNYKIYVNGADYTNNQGYMGHITNLPQSKVGETYDIKVVVDGYKPYYETITIPKSENNDGNAIVFVNVNTQKNVVETTPQEKYYLYGYEVTQMPYYDGKLMRDNTDLIMKGGSHTNNRVVNERRDGNGVITVKKFNVKNKRILSSYTVYGEQYCYYAGHGVDQIISGKGVTTHHSWAGSKVVPSGTKLYKIMTLTDSTYNIKVATGNFNGVSGSTLLYEESGNLSETAKKAINSPQSIHFIFGDNYGNENNYMIAHYLSVENLPNTQTDNTLNTASNWAKDEINKAIKVGLETERMTSSNFKENATREEFCELVMTMYEKLGGRVETYNNSFSDTTNQSAIKAYNAGIINGTSATTFSPNNNITREELCVMIMRAIDLSNKQYELKSSFQKQYDDIDEISPWAKKSVEILNAYKIINGNGTSLNPKGTVTKEMAVLMLYRAYEMFK